METHLLSGTLWNYTSDNTNQSGDYWNWEDLSIFSRDQQLNPADIYSGGRALRAVVRPYPRCTAGEPLGLNFNYRQRRFSFRFRHDPAVAMPTEIFVPALPYPSDYLVGSAISESYRQLSEKAPQLYGWLFEGMDSDDVEESIRANLWVGQLGQPFLTSLEDFISEMAPDAIVCTMQWPAMAVGYLKKEGRLSLPIYVVVTDFIAHGSWFNYGVNAYFLPSEITRYQCLTRGIPEDILHVTGIPVRLEITQPKPMAEMRARHQLPVEGPLLTLFGGGIDSKRVRSAVSMLLKSTIPATLVVVSGRNQTLVDELADLTSGLKMQLLKLEMIDFVDDLVAASDLVITKAGGLTVSEVLARGTPMVIFEPLPGQEEWNADIVAGYGAGIQLRTPELAALTALQLLLQPERVVTMRERAKAIGRPRAALDIAKHIIAGLSASGN